MRHTADVLAGFQRELVRRKLPVLQPRLLWEHVRSGRRVDLQPERDVLLDELRAELLLWLLQRSEQPTVRDAAYLPSAGWQLRLQLAVLLGVMQPGQRSRDWLMPRGCGDDSDVHREQRRLSRELRVLQSVV